MKKNIILTIIIIFILSSCGGGGKSSNDNSTQEDNSTDIRITETNTTELNTTIIEPIEDNLTIELNTTIDSNTTNIESNTSIDDNLTTTNPSIPYQEDDVDVSGNIYIGDGEPQEATITQEELYANNITVKIKDDFSLTNVNNFLFTLNIDELNEQTIDRLKQFITLGIALDYNQTDCIEADLPLTLEDYNNSCIVGVNQDNLEQINLAIEGSTLSNTRDIKVALSLIDELGIKNNDIQKADIKPQPIADENQTEIITTSFTVEDFTNGSFIGINSNNIDDMNHFITYQLHLQTLDELKNVIDRAYQYNISVNLECKNPNANQEHNLSAEGYRFACISTNNTDNLTSLATDLNLTNTKEIRDIYQTAYAIGIDLAPPPAPVECPKDSKERIYIKKTGQTNILEPYDDGYYRAGISPCYERKDLGDDKGIVIDKIRGTMWQDSKEIAKKGWVTKPNSDKCLHINTMGQKDYADENKTIVSYEYTEDDVCELLYDNGDTAYNYCQNLELGGYDDWRLPYILELMDISNYQNPAWIDDNTMSRYAIDDTFRYTAQPAYWARDHYIGYHFEQSWVWGARTGSITPNSKDIILNVRCIRGDSFLAKKIIREDGYSDQSYTEYDSYTHLDDDIIRDNIRMVEWFRVPREERKDWRNSVKYCPTLTKAGGGWRLANINELATLYDNHTYLPSIKEEFQKGGITVAGFWSSTTVSSTPGNSNQAFANYTYKGSLAKNRKNLPEPSFCIRDIVLDSNSSSK